MAADFGKGVEELHPFPSLPPLYPQVMRPRSRDMGARGNSDVNNPVLVSRRAVHWRTGWTTRCAEPGEAARAGLHPFAETIGAERQMLLQGAANPGNRRLAHHRVETGSIGAGSRCPFRPERQITGVRRYQWIGHALRMAAKPDRG